MPLKLVRSKVSIPSGKARLEGDLALPERARGLVLFPFASGGGAGHRMASREAFVASALHRCGYGSLLFNLLTHGEDRLASLRYNIKLLSARLVAATHWSREGTAHLPVAYCAAGTAAAAAFRAADRLGALVRAVVVRGGRPDLAGAVPLEGVVSPSLFIVAEGDVLGREPQRQAYERLACPRAWVEVPGASEFFGEPGTLDAAAQEAVRWLSRWCAAAREEDALEEDAAAEPADLSGIVPAPQAP